MSWWDKIFTCYFPPRERGFSIVFHFTYSQQFLQRHHIQLQSAELKIHCIFYVWDLHNHFLFALRSIYFLKKTNWRGIIVRSLYLKFKFAHTWLRFRCENGIFIYWIALHRGWELCVGYFPLFSNFFLNRMGSQHLCTEYIYI